MSTEKIKNCPLCDQPANFNATYNIETDVAGYRGECERCGRVVVSSQVISRFKDMGTVHLLSAFFRRHVSSRAPIVAPYNVDQLIADMPLLRTVPEKMNGLLRILVTDGQPGVPTKFNYQTDYPLIFARNGLECSFLIEQLAARKLVDNVLMGGKRQYTVTANGYERFEELEASSYKSTRNAFVAMWFDESRDLIYKEAIEPAIREAGYHAIRIDKKEHVNRIDDEIIAELKQSRFLVADFTGLRAGVYYEAGFMHGLGRNVFWIVEKQDLDKVHFDVRQYNFIDYDSPADAKSRLYYRIMAVEGEGPGLANSA